MARFRTRLQKVLVLKVAAETHHPFDSRAVVPTAIKEDEFTCCGQVGDIALKVPVRRFSLGGLWQCNNAADAGVQHLSDAFDRASFAGRIAAFKNDHNSQPFMLDPFLQLDQFDL